MEAALRGASVVLFVVTKNFLRSKFCLQELQWACDHMQRQRQQAQQGQQDTGALTLVPIFYHDQDSAYGFGIDSFQRGKLDDLLREYHAAVSPAVRAPWLDALLILSKRTGIRQDSTGRCVS